jgi:hypothetical protein
MMTSSARVSEKLVLHQKATRVFGLPTERLRFFNSLVAVFVAVALPAMAGDDPPAANGVDPALDQGDASSIDLKRTDEILKSANPQSRCINAYHVGLFLKNHGNPEGARRYLRMVIESPGVGVNEWGRTHAILALRDLDDHGKSPREGSGGLD